MEGEIESELEARMDHEFAAYRNAREAEIQNRLARFRYEREAELHDQLSDKFDAKKTDWSERLELEFNAREAAARKAIMSEIDGRLRNERITHETDLDLLKEETVLELEAEMEERLSEFRTRKEDEVATQLERQLDKREEIMRNKALIEVRKREANIRAEIEAQLGVKRAEIRDRLSTLTQQMDDFRSMAEVKMRESIEGKVQSEIDADENRLAEQQSEFDTLKSQDSRAEKRQSWLQAISGEGTKAGQPQMGIDPSALGARPTPIGSNAGRPMRGAMAQAAAQHMPSMGLAGMRAPRSTAKSLSGAQPMARPVKAPIGGMNLPAQAANLPQPIMPKVVRKPIEPVVQSPEILQPVVEEIPQPIVETPKLEIQGVALEETPEVATTELEPVSELVLTQDPQDDGIPTIDEQISPSIEEDLESMDEVLEEALDEAMTDEMAETQPTAMLTPLKVLQVVSEPKIATLKPITTKVLNPVKRRGAPPSSLPGMKPGETTDEVATAVLKPVKKMNPVDSPNTTLNVSSKTEDE